MNLLDPELGARYRALITTLVGVATSISYFLQEIVNVCNFLPDTGTTAGIGAAAAGLITLIGRFTNVGNTATPPARWT